MTKRAAVDEIDMGAFRHELIEAKATLTKAEDEYVAAKREHQHAERKLMDAEAKRNIAHARITTLMDIWLSQ